MRDSASSLGLFLKGISNKELGIPELQTVLDKSVIKKFDRNDSVTLSNIATSITAKFKKYKEALEEIGKVVEEDTKILTDDGFTRCCAIPVHQFKVDPQFGVGIKPRLTCSKSLLNPTNTGVQYQSGNLTKIFQQNLGTVSGLLWQYYIDTNGDELVHPAHSLSGPGCNPSQYSHNKLLLQTVHRETKNVVFVVDQSSLLSSHQFSLAIDTLQFMLTSLGSQDRVGFVLLSRNAQVFDIRPGSSCTMGQLVQLRDDIKVGLLKYLARIGQEEGRADIEAGLGAAYKIITNSNHRLTDHTQIVVITGRKFENDKELETILEALDKESDELKKKVSLSFVMMQNIGQMMFRDRELVERIIDAGGTNGKIFLIQGTSALSTLGDWYSAFKPKHQANPVLVSKPVLDDLSKKVTVALTKTVFSGSVIGMDIALSEIIEDVYWVERNTDSKMFIIDVTGVTISHPDLSLETITRLIAISNVETKLGSDDDNDVLIKIKTVPSGSVTVNDTVYTWQKIDDTPYVVLISRVVREAGGQMIRVESDMHVSTSGVTWHSQISEGSSKLCRHLGEAASMQTAALYLSPAAFTRPADHLTEAHVSTRVQSYMAYLTDPTRLIANPGLKQGVRDDVQIVSQVTDTWKQQAYSSPLNNYIVRRRVLTPRGVQLSYPGAGVVAAKDPTLAAWFRLSLELAGQVTVSPPYLDSGGAGYIVTMATSLTINMTTAGVMALDFTQGYFHKIVNDSLHGDLCHHDNMTCFLMDHQGYLITHTDMINNINKRHGQPLHLTHLEPTLATDLLSDKHPGFMTKSVCRDHSSDTRQRIFTINLDYDGPVQSSDDFCSQYSLERVTGTNLYLGVVNKTCPQGTSFCWCSTIDRSCLDCSRMSQDECECPCECPNDHVNVCGDENNDDIPTCPPQVDQVPEQKTRFSRVRLDQLPDCIQTDCGSRNSERECYGVLGCSWCKYAPDTITELTSPFCSSQEVCYSGIMSYPSPYSKMSTRTHHQILASESERPLFRASPIGPVAGGIMAFFVLLALIGWAYRHWSRGERRLLVNSSDQDRVIMDGGYEEDTPEDISGGSGGHNNYALHHNSITVVSPYRMNPTYRRPRPAPGTDSDHGYSTMTPCGDQDSEIMSCLGSSVIATNQARKQEKFKSKNPLSLQSVTSGVSSRTASPVQLSKNKHDGGSGTEEEDHENSFENIDQNDTVEGMTSLHQLGRNQIVVAATIHSVETQ